VTSQLDRPDIGSLANLFVGQSRGEQEDLAAVQALFTRAGIIPAIGKKLLDRTIENPQVYLAKSNTHCGPGDPIPMKHSTFRCGSAGVR
jgi:hypothetical protein